MALVLAGLPLLSAAAAPATFSARVEGEFVLLHNGGNLQAAVSPRHGGELAGLSILHDGRWQQLLYRGMDYGDAPGWRGKAPLLWPATGVSIASDGEVGRYRLGERTFDMPFHGFARSRPWQVVATGEDANSAYATLRLIDDADSRRMYPFGFELQVTYRLEAERLQLEYRVQADAANPQPMPFSIGNHITFRAPLIDGPDEAADVQFETGLPTQLLTGADKAYRGDSRASPLRGRHALRDLPQRESASLSGTDADARLVVNDPSGLRVILSHRASAEPAAPVVRFNLWADMEQGFFSPEPWLGTQNSLNSGFGLIRLAAGEQWRWLISIEPTMPVPAITPAAEVRN